MNTLSGCPLAYMSVIYTINEPISFLDYRDLVNEKCGFNHERTTSSTIVNSLFDKGFLKKEKKGRQMYYSPTYPKEEFQAHYVEELVSEVFSGNTEDFLATVSKLYGEYDKES